MMKRLQHSFAAVSHKPFINSNSRLLVLVSSCLVSVNWHNFPLKCIKCGKCRNEKGTLPIRVSWQLIFNWHPQLLHKTLLLSFLNTDASFVLSDFSSATSFIKYLFLIYTMKKEETKLFIEYHYVNFCFLIYYYKIFLILNYCSICICMFW